MTLLRDQVHDIIENAPSEVRAALVEWCERSYRRGFQHGVEYVARTENVKGCQDDAKRFRWSRFSADSRQNSPLEPASKIASINERHLQFDDATPRRNPFGKPYSATKR